MTTLSIARGVVVVLAVVTFVGAAGATVADAAPVTFWGCHGPAGQPLGRAAFAGSAVGDGVADAFAGGCDAAEGALDDGGLRAAFTRADPAAGSDAGWRVELPAGAVASRVTLIRRTRGLGGAQRYVAETAEGLLESSVVVDGTNAPLDGEVTFATTGRGYVRLGVGCASTPTTSERCAASSATPAAVEVGAVAVTVDDAEAPRGAVGGVVSPASGTLTLRVRASDVGLGLANAQASVDGVVVASTDLGGSGCADLSPGNAAVDLPLGGGCPANVEDLQLPVATPMFGDGPHQLWMSVTDAAGNGAVLVDEPIIINNTLPFQQSTAVLTLAGSVVGPGNGLACLAPRLSMFLKDKPLKVVKGVPVLRRNGRYRYSGTLTCAVNGRRVHAPAGVVVALRNQIGKRIYKKNGVATRSGGGITVILAYPTSRLLEFRYTSIDGTTRRVRLRVTVVKATKKKGAR
jgi:hypothetical protein